MFGLNRLVGGGGGKGGFRKVEMRLKVEGRCLVMDSLCGIVMRVTG